MCGRYASSRQPEDLVEEFEVVEHAGRRAAGGRLQRRADQGGLRRRRAPPSREPDGAPSRRSASSGCSRWGSCRPGPRTPDRQPDDQRPDGDRRREARLPQGLRQRALPAARPTATSSGTRPRRTKAGKPLKQPFFIRPQDGGVLAMAGLYEIWRDPTRAEDDPDRFRWTCTVLTTEAEDALGHIHDRMPLMVERDRWHDVARPDDAAATTCSPPRAGGARPARGLPGLDAGQQRAQQRPRAARAAARWRSVRVKRGVESGRSTRRTARAGCTPTAPRSPSRRCCSATAPAAASRPATWRRWPTRLPAQGITVVRLRAAVAGRRPQGRHRPADPRRGPRRGGRRAARAHARSSSAAGPPAPARAARTARDLGAVGLPRAVLPAAPARAGRSRPGSTSCAAPAADAGGAGGARPDGSARGVPRRPDRLDWSSSRRPTTASRCPRAARQPGGGAGRSSSRRRWSGWSARSSGIPGARC